MSGMQGIEVGSLVAKLIGDDKGLQTTLLKNEKDVESFGKTFRSMMDKNVQKMQSTGKIMTVGLTAPFIAGSFQIAKMGLNLQATDAKFNYRSNDDTSGSHR